MVKTAVRVFPQLTTSSEASSLRHRPAVRQHAGWQNHRLEDGSVPRGQRVLDGLSGARAGGRVLAALEMFNPLSFENEI